jgi:HAD superfamily hydrolase (TIGR01484 family)
MSPAPIAEMTAERARGLRYVLMDIDDTLTTEGKLPASSYSALWDLKKAGLRVVPITGRPAGWCDLIAREWPVDGVVGENGAFAYWEAEGHRLRSMTHPAAVRNDCAALDRIRQRALAEVPGCRVARDQFARLYDLAIDFAEEEPALPLAAAIRIKAICDEEGAIAKISSIHVNAWMGNYDKLGMAEAFLAARFGYEASRDLESVAFAGDSPNDEPMFARFPASCGVANVLRYASLIATMPRFVATKDCGEGFAEIARTIIERRGER